MIVGGAYNPDSGAGWAVSDERGGRKGGYGEGGPAHRQGHECHELGNEDHAAEGMASQHTCTCLSRAYSEPESFINAPVRSVSCTHIACVSSSSTMSAQELLLISV